MGFESFRALSWFLSGTTALAILFVFRKFPHVALKPSFVVVAFLNLTNQWSSAIQSARIWDSLIWPWDYFFIVQVFPLVALMLSLCLFDRQARRVFNQLMAPLPEFGRRDLVASLAMGLACVGIMGWYFSFVKFKDTGFYSLFTDPRHTNLIRERCLKLLTSQGVKYAHAFLSTTLAPLLAVVLALWGGSS